MANKLAKQIEMMEEPTTYRLDSVKHAQEGHLKGGISAGLANAANRGGSLHSFSENEHDDDEDDQEGSYSSETHSRYSDRNPDTNNDYPVEGDDGTKTPKIDY